ncbi:MAG: mycofactocin biosynthesis glycosyltransferase MftF [Actinomycetota bacterium]
MNPSARRFHVDSSWWRHRSAAGDTLVAGSPLRLFRLGAEGSHLADVLESDGRVPAGTESLAERFLAAGAIHPMIEESTLTPLAVTVVIPAHDEDPARIAALVRQVSAAARVIVVDDGSARSLGPIDGAEVVRRETAGGPAAARNTGAARATTDIVLFLDADTEWDPAGWTTVLGHFDDAHVGLVAPRVASRPGTDLVARYEITDSPLDLGPEPARVRAGSRVSYVPTAALLVRREVFESLNGFDESFRYGEDVDFVWRAIATDHICRYEPAAVARHRARPDIRALARQRWSYGSAAAALDERHPDAAAPLRVNRWSAIAWSLVAIGHPLVGGAVGAGSTAALPRKLGATPHRWLVAGRLAGLGNLHAGRLMASAITRSWWPVSLVAAVLSRRLRFALLVALVVPNLYRWRASRSELDPVRYVALRIVDDASYGAGVWTGVWRSRRLGALRPRFD